VAIEFTLATLNVWGLPSGMSWPPRRVRFPRIIRFLEEHTFDVVVFQELWKTPLRPRFDVKSLIEPKEGEPNSGLAIATHFPVVAREHRAYALGAPFVEGLWSAKGTMHVTLDVDGHRVHVVDTHTQAYRGAKWTQLRAKHLAALIEIARDVKDPIVIAGDFNVYSRIDTDVAALTAIERAGFVDAVAKFDATPTYDMFGERERFDRVYVRGLEPLSARVHVDAKLADHRPVEVKLRLS
jgi:endonuclease/exonuclease/phosphatase family metal-dependent hydrolase